MMRSCVHPELFNVWYNATQLFTPSKTKTSSNTPPSPSPPPTISLKDVNTFAMRNIPKPFHYSLQSCSPDPSFYKNGLHLKPAPYGKMYGYHTNCGVVPVPNEPVYGHVWSHTSGDWVLHASCQEKEVFIKQRRISRASQRRIQRGTRHSTFQLR